MNPLRALPLPDEVHLHRFDLDGEAANKDAFWQTFSEDERERASRYHFPKDRDRFIAGRGLLRQVLGEYLGIETDTVVFGYAPHGKPYLAHDTPLRFNLSHSHNVGLLAVTNGRAVGVDIERVRTDMPLEEMARAVFSPQEQERLRALPTEEKRRDYFFALWTLKEAFVKAIGEGLSYPLQEFTVTFAGSGAALEHRKGDVGGEWWLQRLAVNEEYHAAVAVRTTNKDNPQLTALFI